MKNNKLPLTLTILSFLGLLDGAYLTWKHYSNGSVSCSLTAGCEQVLTSQYSLVAGIPLSLIGTVYYMTLFFLSIALLDTSRPVFLKIIALVSGTGVFVSSYLVYLQISTLKSLCIYCMFSASITLLLFILAGVNAKTSKYPNEVSG